MDETARLKQDPHAELVAKHPWYFQVTNDLAEVNVFLLDGSLIDEEYFSTLEPQTTLILQKPGEKVLSGSCCQLSTFNFMRALVNVSCRYFSTIHYQRTDI